MPTHTGITKTKRKKTNAETHISCPPSPALSAGMIITCILTHLWRSAQKNQARQSPPPPLTPHNNSQMRKLTINNRNLLPLNSLSSLHKIPSKLHIIPILQFHKRTLHTRFTQSNAIDECPALATIPSPTTTTVRNSPNPTKNLKSIINNNIQQPSSFLLVIKPPFLSTHTNRNHMSRLHDPSNANPVPNRRPPPPKNTS